MSNSEKWTRISGENEFANFLRSSLGERTFEVTLYLPGHATKSGSGMKASMK